MNERAVAYWILLALVLVPVSTAVAWTAFAPEPEPRLETPEPMEGEAGAWTWRQHAADGSFEDSRWYFEFLPAQKIVGADGLMHETHPLRITSEADGATSNTWHMDATSPGRVVAQTEQSISGMASESHEIVFTRSIHDTAPPCGFWFTGAGGRTDPHHTGARPECMLPDASATINGTTVTDVDAAGHVVDLVGADGSTLHLTSGLLPALAWDAVDQESVRHQWILEGHRLGDAPYPAPRELAAKTLAEPLPPVVAPPRPDPGTESLVWPLDDALSIPEAKTIGEYQEHHPGAWLYMAEFKQTAPRADGTLDTLSWRLFYQHDGGAQEFLLQKWTAADQIVLHRLVDAGVPVSGNMPSAAGPHGLDWRQTQAWLDASAPPPIEGEMSTGWKWSGGSCEGCGPELSVWRATKAPQNHDQADIVGFIHPEYADQSNAVRLVFDAGGDLREQRILQSEGFGSGLSEARLSESLTRSLGDQPPRTQAAAPEGLHGPKTELVVLAAGFAITGAALVWWLRRVPGLFLFTRIGQKQILAHPTRQKILESIDADPGIHFAELAKRSRLSFGVLTHHLKKLVHVEEVVVHEAKGYTCYFRVGSVDRRLMALVPLLKSDGARKVMEAVRQHPGQNVSTLAVHAGLSPSVVHHHIKRMKASGLVRTERQGRSVCLYPEPILQQAAAVGA